MKNGQKEAPADNRSLTAKIKDLELENKSLKRLVQKHHDELEIIRLDIGLLQAKIGE